MLDIKELEQQWKQYNNKRKRPLYIMGFLGLLIVSGSIFVVNKNFDFNKINIDNFSNLLSVKNEQKSIETKPVIVKSKNDYLLNDYLKDMILLTKPKTVESTNSLTPLDDEDLYIEKDISKPVINKKKISIIKVSNNNAYRDVERRFRRTHNINDSIFLANMYYKRKNYKKAIYWSMQTNKLDKNIEESWLIFAKSKVKLGHKNEAIRVLKAYIKRSNSYEARKLLKKIINN